MFSGVYTALVTPFRDGLVDLEALSAQVETQIAAGIDGLVPCGTTGEASTLSETERLSVIETTVTVAAGRCTVIAGVGTNNTAESVRLTQAAKLLGADGALVITPYYNKPTQEGLYQHCRAVAVEGDLPVVIYNVPGRTGVSFTVDTVVRLAEEPHIVALKEATADMIFGADIIRRCGNRLAVLSGDDHTALPLWAVGGVGVVSVVSNLVPERMVALWRAFSEGNLAQARTLHLEILPLLQALFWESNPGPVKALMAWTGMGIRADMRLPLVPPSVETSKRLRALAIDCGLVLSGRA